MSILRVFLLGLLVTTWSVPTQRAAERSVAPGAIAGRVFNTGTSEYLENARVTVEGTALETLTDSTGRYAFASVPAGEARVKVFYTGLVPETAVVAVSSGTSVQRDFNLGGLDPSMAAGSGVVKLGSFVVASSREMDGAAIAINEKRFAADIRNVVAADEFGPMADGNVGEILKTVPGVAIDYVGGSAMGISLNGVPSGYVPVTMNGFPLASTTATSPTSRDVELVNVATNNLSRIEVLHSPTPESPGNALAGSVNMVPRGAFDRARPVFTSNVYVMMRDDAIDFDRGAGPGPGSTRRIHPGVDFSYVAPVSPRFGFTLSGGTSTQYQPSAFVQTTWRGVSAATNGTTLPDTTPDKPYLSDYLVSDWPRQSRRTSAAATLDFKLTPVDRISLSLQAVFFDAQYSQRNLQFSVNRVAPGNFSLDHTYGFAGAGTLTLSNPNDRDRSGVSFTPSLVYRHDGPIWKIAGGIGFSRSRSTIRNLSKGYFSSVTATRTGVTIAFDDIFYLRPGRITVTDGATGTPVDPYNLSSYNITAAGGNADANGYANRTFDVQRNAYANVGRDFDWRLPVKLKAGLDVRQAMRDYRGGNTPFTFVGADGRANSGDERAAPFLDEGYSQRDGVYGFPKTQRLNPSELWSFYQAQPTSFAPVNENTVYRSAVNLSKHAEETISSAYLRGDLAFLQRRLKLTGGVRAEQTNVEAEGPLTDPTRNFQRRPDGSVIRGANGQPLLIVPPSDALGVSRLTFLDRGAKTSKEYIRFFPSLNASYNVRENLIVRAAYYWSVGRPNYNQYAGGVILPDVESAPSSSNRLTLSNVGIKAWTARTTKLSLEYYFERVGLISIGGFQRDFENFFGSTVMAATPEFLDNYELDPAVYGNYEIATQRNVEGTVRMEGFDVSYKQALTFLPNWARGVQVFANAASQRATGEESDNFANYIPKTATWGISLNRPKYSVKLNWNYKSRHRRALVTGRSIGPNTYAWGSKRLFVDIIGDYQLTKRITIFGNIRNLRDTPEDFSREGPDTPEVAQFRQRDRYGALWILGVKGVF